LAIITNNVHTQQVEAGLTCWIRILKLFTSVISQHEQTGTLQVGERSTLPWDNSSSMWTEWCMWRVGGENQKWMWPAV